MYLKSVHSLKIILVNVVSKINRFMPDTRAIFTPIDQLGGSEVSYRHSHEQTSAFIDSYNHFWRSYFYAPIYDSSPLSPPASGGLGN